VLFLEGGPKNAKTRVRTTPPGIGPIKTAPYLPGQGIVDVGITKGRNVLLACEGKYVWAEISHVVSRGEIMAKVLFIEPPGAKLEGISEGDTIAFEDDQVIGIS
jgi:hypothetical protein